MSDAALRHRIREGGAWQVLLPGVHASCTGSATVQQRETAAVLYIAVPDAWWPDAGVVVEIAALVAGSKRGRLDIRALPAR